MAMKPYSGELNGSFPCTVVISAGRIISVRPSAQTARVWVERDDEATASPIIIRTDPPDAA